MAGDGGERGAARILVVDDSEATQEILRRNLEAEGYEILTAADVATALAVLERMPVDLVVTDVKMPGGSGLDLVRHVRENHRDTEITVITGFPDVSGAVTALKSGATDYLTKPFTADELRAAVRGALDRLHARRTERAPEPPARPEHGLLGQSEAMRGILAQIERATRSRATVLISGESGTGKELVARAIHYHGTRPAGPFVAVNCGAIPQELAESEMFGHARGAFTGATESRTGFFIAADGGSIFLDEVSELAPAMQVKLLRVLQDKEVHTVGAARPQKVDVRIIAATNKDLAELVRRGLFREDLYYRLNVITIHLPPLRERGDDATLLAQHFLARFAAELGREPPRLSDGALAVLRRHSWPGNVREVENLIQRLVVMVDADVIDVPDLPALMRFSAAAGGGLDRTLAEVEEAHIRAVLAAHGGNKTQAARALGIDRKTLRAKLELHRIADDGADS